LFSFVFVAVAFSSVFAAVIVAIWFMV